MGDELDDALRQALRREAYRPHVMLDGARLRSRIAAGEARHRARQWTIGAGVGLVGLAGLAVLALAALPSLRTAPAAGGLSTPAPCVESAPMTHGSWWVEIGGPRAFFNVEPRSLYAAANAWLITVRFDPDAGTGESVAMWAEAVAGGERVDAAFNSPMDPGTIYRFDSPAPDLPGGWYLFEQRLPTAGCWRLVAAIDGQVAGAATIFVALDTTSPRSSADDAAPTPELASATPSNASPTDRPPGTSVPGVVVPRPLPTVAEWNGVCGGVGLDATLTGDPSDPRLAWLVGSDGRRIDVIWPPGYSARFTPRLEVLDEQGSVVMRDGSSVIGGCVTGSDAQAPILIVPSR
jgi:hypothetical protein